MVTYKDIIFQLKLLPKNDNTGILETAIKDIEEFSLLFVKKRNLAIYVICKEQNIPVFTSIPGVTADRIKNEDLDEIFKAKGIQLHMTNDCVYPMTVDVEECQILQNAAETPNFVIGISCKTKSPGYVVNKATRIINKTEKKSKDETMFADDVRKKAKSHTFYLSNIFISAEKKDIPTILSNINFTVRNRQPNGLALGKKDIVRRIIRTPRTAMFRKQFLRKRCVNVLSPAELSSLFTLPTYSEGLEMESGRNKTGANEMPEIDIDPLEDYTEG